MPKVRLGVALLVPAPLASEVDGLRRASGDGALGRIPPHITLVPPVNVREDRLGDALAVVRAAAAGARPLTLVLGPPATFMPVNPVLYLGVGGEEADIARLRVLRDSVYAEPLARPLTWPWVPHVTLADEAEPERIAAAVASLASYRVEARFDRVHVLREGPGRVWEPVADAQFAAPSVVGRGGLPLELAVTDRLDPEAASLCDGPGRVFAVTARRDGVVVGTAAGATPVGAAAAAGAAAAGPAPAGAAAGQAVLSWLLVRAGERGQGIGSHLLAAVTSLAADRGCSSITAAAPAAAGEEVASFLRCMGWFVDGDRLRRDLG